MGRGAEARKMWAEDDTKWVKWGDEARSAEKCEEGEKGC